MGALNPSGSPAAILAAQQAAASAAAAAASLAAAVVQGKYVSAQVALSAAVGVATTFAHGLGVAPQFCVAKLTCAVADAGYSVGDEIELSGYVDAGFGSVTIASNSAQVFVVIGGAIRVTNKATPAAVTALTATSWNLKVEAYK